MGRGRTIARRKTMYERQETYRFGAEYLAATMATRDEAPPNSRPSQLKAAKLGGRKLQLMSIPERKAVTLALYNPNVIEIFDQALLWPSEHLNPLAVLDPDRANRYPEFRGTIDVAERLGYIDIHPTIRYKKNGKSKLLPWPYQGDLLLFQSNASEFRCTNWSVKKKRADFLRHKRGDRRTEERSRRRQRARYEIELVYYNDAGIPTVPVTEEELDQTLVANLLRLCCYSSLKTELEPAQSASIVDAFVAGMATGVPPSVTIARVAMQERCSVQDAKIVFHHAVWERKLRIDLFSPLRIDRPAIPEQTDVLAHYADWFEAA